MSKKISAIVTLTLLCSVVIGGTCPAYADTTNNNNTQVTAQTQQAQSAEKKADNLYQVSLLNGLMQGDYDGSVPVGELLKHGDTGLGSFDKLDGEMIVINGEVFKAKSDGTVEKQPDNELVPFASVCFMDDDYTIDGLNGISNINDLKTYLDNYVKTKAADKNAFYMVKINGDFDLAHVRSVPKQEKPYKPLNEVASSQKEYKYNNVKGTIVALYCPDYMNGINLPTWHFHFITDDRTKGGHLLDVKIKSAKGTMDKMDDYNLVLPTSKTFADMDLAKDLSKETAKTESK